MPIIHIEDEKLIIKSDDMCVIIPIVQYEEYMETAELSEETVEKMIFVLKDK